MTTSEIFDRADFADELRHANENAPADWLDETDTECEIVLHAEWEKPMPKFPESYIVAFPIAARDAVVARAIEMKMTFFNRPQYGTTIEFGADRDVHGFVGYNDDLDMTIIGARFAGEENYRLV